MRKVILGVAMSLDGFIEGPNGEYDWCFTDQDYGMSAFFKRIDAIFMGRKSYEVSKSANAQSPEGGNPWKGITTYVFSNSMKTLDGPDLELISGDTIGAARKLKEKKGKDIWLFGGAELTTSLMNESLVDELWLSIHPVLLGAGKPMFQNLGTRKNLKVTQHQVYNTGLVQVCYEPVESVGN
jgi:dihydrofolate reductase